MPSSQHALGSVQPEMLTLPSMRDETTHNTCMVKKLTPADLIAGELLDRFDSLTGIVGLEIEKINGNASPDETMHTMLAKLRGNKEQIAAGLAMVDEIVEMSLVDPVVFRPVNDAGEFVPFAERNKDTIPRAFKMVQSPIWTDMVADADKGAIVDFAMSGVRALEGFHAATPGGVGSVSTKPKVRKPAKRVAGHK